MLKHIRTFIKTMHVLQAKIKAFQHIAIQFFDLLIKLPKFQINQGKLIRQKSMLTLLVQTINRLHVRIPPILINIEVQYADHVNRAECITIPACIYLIVDLESGIIQSSFYIAILLPSLDLHNNP